MAARLVRLHERRHFGVFEAEDKDDVPDVPPDLDVGASSSVPMVSALLSESFMPVPEARCPRWRSARRDQPRA